MNTKPGNSILACTQFHSCEMFWERKELCKPDYSCQFEYNKSYNSHWEQKYILTEVVSLYHPLRKMWMWIVLRKKELCKPDYICQHLNTITYIESYEIISLGKCLYCTLGDLMNNYIAIINCFSPCTSGEVYVIWNMNTLSYTKLDL